MWLKKVKEIDYPVAFDSFTWTGEDLKKYNLIYGWNGTGKTTLSRLFNFLERKEVHIPELQTAKFKITTDRGFVDELGLGSSGASIRVFNEDFIRENLEFEESKVKKIIILGRENIEVQKEIASLELEVKSKRMALDQLGDERKKLPKLDSILTDAASAVAKQFATTPLAAGEYYGRNYKKPKVDKLLADGEITEQNGLSLIITDPNEIDSKRQVIKEEKKRIEITTPQIPEFAKLFKTANDLLRSNIQVQPIQRLENDSVLRNWVETGYDLHKKRELTACEFCGNALPDNLLSSLGQFFTEELKQIKEEIISTVIQLGSDDNKIHKPDIDSSALFPELVDQYMRVKEKVDSDVLIVESALDAMTNNLSQKKDNLHDHSIQYEAVAYPKSALQSLNTEIKNLRNLIDKHNTKLESISDVITKAAKNIELHTVASMLTDREYFKHKKNEGEIVEKITRLASELDQITQQIQTKKASIQNASEAVSKINPILQEYFGESHIYLEVSNSDDGEVGYVLKRRGQEAKMLSEGEKSVLALVHFLIKLNEDGFEKSNGIVIVDDPVDSQDEIFLFRTFGLIKRQLKDASQLIILTHNYNFFNLIRDWFCENRNEPNSQLYIIRSDKDDAQHSVSVENLPDLLRKYKSEYQYLFCRLFQYSEGIKSLDEPLVGNIARKILEYFSSFKWSCRSTEQFTSIVLNRFVADPNQLKKGTGDFIVKFLHEHSHGQDFSRPITAPMLEAKAIAQNVLKFIELADKEHYDHLKSICEEDSAQTQITPSNPTVLSNPAT